MNRSSRTLFFLMWNYILLNSSGKKNIKVETLFGTLIVFIAVKRTRPFSTCTKLKKLFEVLKFHSRTSILF